MNFRRIFDPRLTEEYQVVGEPYSRQTGDGEAAALRIGASLWGTANQTLETKARTHVLEKPGAIGCQYGYPRPGGGTTLELTTSPIFNQQVIDLDGQIIPGLYCAGESASGFNQHGLAKCIVEGRIAGRDVAMSRTSR